MPDRFFQPGNELVHAQTLIGGDRKDPLFLETVLEAGGAFRRFDDSTAELKRIWTDSRYRRQGHAKALLNEAASTEPTPQQ